MSNFLYMTETVKQSGASKKDRLIYGDPIATTLAEAKLPHVEGVEYVDVSHELDEPLGDRTVEYSAMFAFSDSGQHAEANGRTLREAMESTSAIPLVGPLVVNYTVYDNSKRGHTKDYIVNGELIGSPEEAEERRITRLAEVMRIGLPAKVGVYLPLLGPHANQQILLYPDITRIVDVKVGVAGVGKFKGDIGVVIGAKHK